MLSTIAFVGAGPTTIYTLAALLEARSPAVRLTVFEAQQTAGVGTPYRPGWNDPAMLANIASIEIPPVIDTLVDWLVSKTEPELHALGLVRDDIDERAFYPRVLLGQYFAEQFNSLLDRARAVGVTVDVRPGCRVVDAVHDDTGIGLTVAPRRGDIYHERFDAVVLATGHQWPKTPEVRAGYFLSPWPASTLSGLPPTSIGIRGSSLTAIDTAVAVAGANGEFIRDKDGVLAYEPAAGTEAFCITMMSRKGLLPEADFYFPLPHPPLIYCTAEAIEQLIAQDEGDLLDRAFALFKQEITACDPDYAAALDLSNATVETFGVLYFAERARADPFDWARANLEEARRNLRDRVTVPWRDAILRMHEVIGLIVPHLDGQAFDRFNRHLKPVFVDDYSSVPHESIERMLALHDAGKLQVLALGDDYRIDTHRPEGGVVVHLNGNQRHFPVFVEATGQPPLSARQFPFPSLLKQGVVRDDISADAPEMKRGIAIDDAFHPICDNHPTDRLFCLSLPFIMGRHPFVQGITSSHDMGRIVGAELAKAAADSTTALPARAA